MKTDRYKVVLYIVASIEITGTFAGRFSVINIVTEFVGHILILDFHLGMNIVFRLGVFARCAR